MDKGNFPMSIVDKRNALRAEIKVKRKDILPALKKAVKLAKADRVKRLKACQAECRTAQAKLKKAEVVARKKLEKYIKRAKVKAGQVCKSCKVIDEKNLNQLENALEELAKTKEEIKEMRARAATMKSDKGRAGGKRAAELRSESDDRVIFNLGENQDLIGLFKKLRRKIKATKHKTRTEAFLEFVHNHPEALDEYRAKKQIQYEKEAERMFAAREEPPCEETLKQCQMELDELRAAERFLEDVDVPF